MKPARILLADDHTLVRAGLRKLLEEVPAVEVVGEADDGRKALELVQALKPDLVLMDLSMPGLTGLEATARIVKAWPKVKVLVLSMHQNQEHVRQALRNGALGYLLKDAAPQELEQALQAVLAGRCYLSPAVAPHGLTPELAALRSAPAVGGALTPRQTEVLRWVAQGLSSKEIARKMDLSVKTVGTHRTAIMEQLDIHEVTGLVRYAMQAGLIPPGL